MTFRRLGGSGDPRILPLVRSTPDLDLEAPGVPPLRPRLHAGPRVRHVPGDVPGAAQRQGEEVKSYIADPWLGDPHPEYPDATLTDPVIRRLYGPRGEVLRTFSDRPLVGFHQGEKGRAR